MDSVELILKDLKAFDGMDAPILFWDKNELCRYANSVCYQWCGKKPADLVDKIDLKTLIGELNYQENYNLIQSSLKGARQNFELRFPLLNHEPKEVSVALLPYTLNGATIGFFLHVTDITGIRQSANPGTLFGRSDEIFKNFIENSPMPAWIVDSENVVHYLNAAYRKAKPNVKVGESFLRAFPREIAEAYRDTNRKILALQQIISGLEKIPDSSGKEKIYKTVKFPLFYQNKFMIGGFAVDITEQLSLGNHSTQ
jgi:PAS domain S-box-containing protein